MTLFQFVEFFCPILNISLTILQGHLLNLVIIFQVYIFFCDFLQIPQLLLLLCENLLLPFFLILPLRFHTNLLLDFFVEILQLGASDLSISLKEFLAFNQRIDFLVFLELDVFEFLSPELLLGLVFRTKVILNCNWLVFFFLNLSTQRCHHFILQVIKFILYRIDQRASLSTLCQLRQS